MSQSKGDRGKKTGTSSPSKSTGSKKEKNVTSMAEFNKMMSECSMTAQVLRQTINDSLESMTPVGSDAGANDPVQGKVKSLDATNLEIKNILEKTIKEKLSDLEEALKEVPSPVSDANTKRSPRSSKEKSPESLVAVKSQPASTMNGSSVKSQPIQQLSASSPVLSQPNDDDRPVTSTKMMKISSVRRSGGKDKFTVDQVAKSLSSYETDSLKLEALMKKHTQILEDNRNLEMQLRQQEKICSQAMKEKEQLQSESNRSILAKSRLENLCRELQRQNKAVKEESLSKIKEEEEKRKEIANKFQATLNEIMQLVQDNQERNVQLKTENSELASKLKSLMNHYESWEKNIHKIIQQKELEIQLMTAKFAQSNLEFNHEKETFLNEKQQLIQMLTELQKRGIESSQNEVQLRAELGMYTSKYQEFQDVLTKSNDTFSNFKKDMEKMSRQIKKLEKETIQWKMKWETSNKSLQALTQEVIIAKCS